MSFPISIFRPLRVLISPSKLPEFGFLHTESGERAKKKGEGKGTAPYQGFQTASLLSSKDTSRLEALAFPQIMLRCSIPKPQ